MEELIDALNRLQEARAALRKCQESCEYDADYFCHSDGEDVKQCEGAFETALNGHIDARVRDAIDALEDDRALHNRLRVESE